MRKRHGLITLRLCAGSVIIEAALRKQALAQPYHELTNSAIPIYSCLLCPATQEHL